jgi:hypothetical protein
VPKFYQNDYISVQNIYIIKKLLILNSKKTKIIKIFENLEICVMVQSKLSSIRAKDVPHSAGEIRDTTVDQIIKLGITKKIRL